MSTEEQDLILGRLVRESKECSRKVQALQVKLSAFSKALSDAVLTINGTWNPQPNPVVKIPDAVLVVAQTLNPSPIIDTLRELETETVRLAQLNTQLDGMN